jgi:glycerophosphoryl diester phosphodiesterase
MNIRAVAVLVGFGFGAAVSMVRPAVAAACVTSIAHRGNAYYGSPIENSMEAFRKSYAVGSRWVESDMQFTVDDVPVLMHPRTVDTVTNGTGAVAGMTAAYFTSLLMKDGVQHPPTLDELLNLVRSNDSYRAMVELKTLLTPAQEQILLTKLQGLEDRVYLNAFDTRLSSLQNLKAANSLLHTSLLAYAPVLPSPAGIEAQDIEYTGLTATSVSQLHAAGLKVRAWTPNSTTTWNKLGSYGVDGIITNKVQALVTWVGTACQADNNPDVDPEPTTREFVANSSFETDLSGWSTATSTSQNSRVAGGYDGAYAARSVNAAASTGKHGLAGKPIDGITATTVAGGVYTASTWVKPDFVGQKISLYVRETDATRVTVNSSTVTLTATTTEWQPLTSTYTASQSGSSISLHVFASNSASNTGFTLDLISFTTPL